MVGGIVGRAVLLLVSMASVALASAALAGAAAAHPLGFESDITEDGVTSFCNPDRVRPGLFEEAISDWNSYASDNSLPVVADVTHNEGAFCELRAQRRGGDSANFFARVVFDAHPDALDISARFNDLPSGQEGATLRHELGHAALGLAHNELCDSSVMPTRGFCRDAGTPRRGTVGPHDVEDRLAYWNGETAIYPIRNKCWTNEDADGDGVCDRFGPPLVGPPIGAEGGARGGPAGGPPVSAPSPVR